jgi:hypothetical protein
LPWQSAAEKDSYDRTNLPFNGLPIKESQR